MFFAQSFVSAIVEISWFLLPGWIANVSLTVLGFLTERFRLRDLPLDFGRRFFDGHRVVGDQVTWGGVGVAIVVGTCVGWVQGRNGLGLWMGLGAFGGDAIGSFLKRRFGIPSGGFLPVVDHCDHVLGSLALTALFLPLSWSWVLACVLWTLALHPLACFIAYKLRLKKVPW